MSAAMSTSVPLYSPAHTNAVVFDVLGAASAAFRAKKGDLVPCIHHRVYEPAQERRKARMVLSVKGGRGGGLGRSMYLVGKILSSAS